MDLVRESLLYPIAVLWIAGLGLLVLPDMTINLLMSNTTFNPMLARLTGMFALGLGSFVVLTYYYRLEKLYIWTLYIRAFFFLVLSTLFITYKNPLFGIILIILIIGIGLTLRAFWYEKEKQ